VAPVVRAVRAPAVERVRMQVRVVRRGERAAASMLAVELEERASDPTPGFPRLSPADS
jgi:hypothetical protein